MLLQHFKAPPRFSQLCYLTVRVRVSALLSFLRSAGLWCEMIALVTVLWTVRERSNRSPYLLSRPVSAGIALMFCYAYHLARAFISIYFFRRGPFTVSAEFENVYKGDKFGPYLDPWVFTRAKEYSVRNKKLCCKLRYNSFVPFFFCAVRISTTMWNHLKRRSLGFILRILEATDYALYRMSH